MKNPTIKEMILSELSLHGDMPKGVRAFIKEHLEEIGKMEGEANGNAD